MTTNLPPCGLYRTAAKIGGIDPGRLVYYHNHGDPGPGLYFPEKWNLNRVQWASQGMTAPTPFDNTWLTPLLAEGFYRVTREFTCCAKKCMTFTPEMFGVANPSGLPVTGFTATSAASSVYRAWVQVAFMVSVAGVVGAFALAAAVTS